MGGILYQCDTISNTVFQVSHSRTSPRTLWAAQRD